MLQPAEVTVVPERPSMSTLPDPGAAAAGSCAWILDTLAIATCACNTDRTSGNMAVPIFTVCLFTVVGGMLCKSDKPSIIIITALHQGHQATPWGTRALGFGVYVGDCAVSGSSGNTLGHEGRDGAVLPQRAGWGCLA